MKFKVGDKVKLVTLDPESEYLDERMYKNKIGFVKDESLFPYVQFEDGETLCFLQSQLELVEEPAGIEHTQQEVPDELYEQELGAKFDQGKPRVDILAKGCPRALLAVGEALGYGAKKYNESPDTLNFLQVEDGFNRYSRAMMGHFLEESINPVDKDSGLDHIVLTAVNALFRLELYLRGKENGPCKDN